MRIGSDRRSRTSRWALLTATVLVMGVPGAIALQRGSAAAASSSSSPLASVNPSAGTQGSTHLATTTYVWGHNVYAPTKTVLRGEVGMHAGNAGNAFIEPNGQVWVTGPDARAPIIRTSYQISPVWSLWLPEEVSSWPSPLWRPSRLEPVRHRQCGSGRTINQQLR